LLSNFLLRIRPPQNLEDLFNITREIKYPSNKALYPTAVTKDWMNLRTEVIGRSWYSKPDTDE
jgi:hypothetical protein